MRVGADGFIVLVAWLVAALAVAVPMLLVVKRTYVRGESGLIRERLGQWNALIVVSAVVGTLMPLLLPVMFPLMAVGRVQVRYSLERGLGLANFLIRAGYVIAGVMAASVLMSGWVTSLG